MALLRCVAMEMQYRASGTGTAHPLRPAQDLPSMRSPDSGPESGLESRRQRSGIVPDGDSDSGEADGVEAPRGAGVQLSGTMEPEAQHPAAGTPHQPHGDAPSASLGLDPHVDRLLERIATVRRNTQDVCARINALIAASASLGVPPPPPPPLPSPELHRRVTAGAVAAGAADTGGGGGGGGGGGFFEAGLGLGPQGSRLGFGTLPAPTRQGPLAARGVDAAGCDARVQRRRRQLAGLAALPMPRWLVDRVVHSVVTGASDSMEPWWSTSSLAVDGRPAPREPLVGLLCVAECNRVGTLTTAVCRRV